jgi:extradiol dioxygenase family protein
LLTLIGLWLVGIAVIVLSISRPIPDSGTYHSYPAIKSARQAARLLGPVRQVAVEKFTVANNGEPGELRKSERIVYSGEGDCIRYERDSLRHDEWNPSPSNPGDAAAQLDTGLSLNEFGFRLLHPGQSLVNPTRLHYAFDFKDLRRHETFYFDERGALAGRSVQHQLDDGERWHIRSTHFNPDGGSKSGSLTVLNKRGDVEESIKYNHEGKTVLHWTYAFDKRGNLVEMTSLDDEGKPRQKVAFSYIYDEQGNWIERTSYGFMNEAGVESTFIPKTVTQRNITYYSNR